MSVAWQLGGSDPHKLGSSFSHPLFTKNSRFFDKFRHCGLNAVRGCRIGDASFIGNGVNCQVPITGNARAHLYDDEEEVPPLQKLNSSLKLDQVSVWGAMVAK